MHTEGSKKPSVASGGCAGVRTRCGVGAGMRRGGRRFVGVPESALCVGAPLAASAETLYYLISLNRIKKASKEPKSAAPALPADTALDQSAVTAPAAVAPAAPTAAAAAAAMPAMLASAVPQVAAAVPQGLLPTPAATPPPSRPGSPRRQLANLMLHGCVPLPEPR